MAKIKHIKEVNPFVSIPLDESVAVPNDIIDGRYAGMFEGEQWKAAMDLIGQAYRAGVQLARSESSVFVVLPAKVLSRNDISANAKILYGAISGLTRREGFCYAKNETLANLMGIAENSINRPLKELGDANLIRLSITRDARGTYRKIYLNMGASENEIGAARLGTQGVLNEVIQKKNQEKKINKKDFIKKPEVSGEVVGEIIGLFEPVNPSFKVLFSRTTERAAVERMVKEHGADKIREVVCALPRIISQPYAPRITTPWQLEQKFGSLVAFVQQHKQKTNVIGMAI